MLATYQIITIFLGGYFIIRTVAQYLRHGRPLVSSIIWITLWAILISLALLPDNLSLPLAGLLGIASNINAVLFFAMGLLFVAVFQQSATISSLERKLTDLVRELAIKEKIDSDKNS